MMNDKPAGTAFREGDEVVLDRGSYQGTVGEFVRLRKTSNGLTSWSATAACEATRWNG